MPDNHKTADCLIEIGMEELPPKAMPILSAALTNLVSTALDDARLSYGACHAYAAPRRLALLFDSLSVEQPDEAIIMRGPPTRVAFADDGKPTRAALAFADKAGVAVTDLQREATDKGEWLVHHTVQKGVATLALLGDIVRNALDALPIPRRMRWGQGDDAFIRPLHWLVIMQGEEVAKTEIFDIAAGNQSAGHRFHHPDFVRIRQPRDYPELLRGAHVIVDFEERRNRVWELAVAAAAEVGGRLGRDDELIDEITALVDWPVAITGKFDARFLDLPVEVLESTLKVHQRYFPVVKENGAAMPYFVTIANIDSRQPGEVQRGNERVVAPRLADAEFFWNNDAKTTLADRRERLTDVIYQKKLGSLAEKTQRVAELVTAICEQLGVPADDSLRAAMLAKCDLLSDMVGEFPDLQGVMGGYYAARDGEGEEIAAAIREQYRPRFAGDAIPACEAGRILSAAERIDTITGIFAIGKKPSGNRDPFGLRRAALGLLRILIEGEIDVDLPALLQKSVKAQPVDTGGHPELGDDIYDYITERLRHYYDESLCADRRDLFDAVLAREPHSMVDFDARLRAVANFIELPQADALAAANKRIANILRGGGVDAYADLDADALGEPAEQRLFREWSDARSALAPLLKRRDYTAALTRLSEMREAVDGFFDEVMVMADDVSVRRNRMALLSEVRALFLEVADISELSSAAGGG